MPDDGHVSGFHRLNDDPAIGRQHELTVTAPFASAPTFSAYDEDDCSAHEQNEGADPDEFAFHVILWTPRTSLLYAYVQFEFCAGVSDVRRRECTEIVFVFDPSE